MLADPPVDAQGEIGPSDAPVGVVGRSESRPELEPARAHDRSDPFEARLAAPALDPRDRGLSRPDPPGELLLGKAGPPPGLPD